ncbi:AMPKBI-domain-containing protein [Metschnikowia bicuspidata]|uniref:AMPKBI-domain-containing protein n=1 Tax=Metschnikowia bicuspidata TaxID=27322 RepID=A0A4P9ZE81_9ASCO|nr:AMPKBI-domain-containing protein [Metschnikowia bicuspidata]
MGNNTLTTRKSLAAQRHNKLFRKLSQSQFNHHNLEEEFSDLILHEVKRRKQTGTDATGDMAEVADTTESADATDGSGGTRHGGKSHFSNDLLEDEYNELGDGILECDAGCEVAWSILPSEAVISEDFVGLADSVEMLDAELAGEQTRGDAAGDSNNAADLTNAAPPAVARQPPQQASTRLGGAPSVDLPSDSANANSSRTSVDELFPVRIKWVNQTMENINKVSVIGSFSNWRDFIKLRRSTHHPNEYLTTLKLRIGVHKLLYVINNEYRVLELLPTATDQEGIFFNWFEVQDPRHLFNNLAIHRQLAVSLGGAEGRIIQVAGEHDASQIQKKSMSFLVKVSKQEKEGEPEHVEYAQTASEPSGHVPHDSATNINYHTYHGHSSTSLIEDHCPTPKFEYSSEIPEILTDYNYFTKKGADYELPEPPQLPAHLNNVLLNKISSSLQAHVPLVTAGNRPALRRADSSYYASNSESYHRVIPNHVILNHLMTTSIRNDVLTVACITRYSGKFVTQVMHSPADVTPDK